MPNPTQYSGGLWPLGQILVTTSGTPQLLNKNVGAQTQSGTTLRRSTKFKQVTITALKTNTGVVYVLFYGNGSATPSKTTTTLFLDILQPGECRSYPNGSLLAGGNGSINIDQIAVDVATSGEGIVAYGVV